MTPRTPALGAREAEGRRASLVLFFLCACGHDVELLCPEGQVSETIGCMVALSPGTFLMGSPPEEVGRSDDETQHEVTLTHPFLFAVEELTEERYVAIAGGEAACPSCPVVKVSWHQAALYANTLSAFDGLSPCYSCEDDICVVTPDIQACRGWRLPTEAEWEYAARGGGTVAEAFANGGTLAEGQEETCKGGIYLGDGLTLGEEAWFCGNADNQTHPVGTRTPSPLGIMDLSGNAWEWTNDGPSPYVHGAVDPLGEGDARVKRGGSWITPPERLRLATRDTLEPHVELDSQGFRLVKTVE